LKTGKQNGKLSFLAECFSANKRQENSLEIQARAVQAARNEVNGSEELSSTLDEYGEALRITEEVLCAAAGNFEEGPMLISTLLERRAGEIIITEKVIKAASKNLPHGEEVMTLLLKGHLKSFVVSETSTCLIAETFSEEIIALLLKNYGRQIRITEKVLKAAAENRSFGSYVMSFLLSEYSDKVQITEEVLLSAAMNPASGARIMSVIYDKYGGSIQITEEVLKAAASNRRPHVVQALCSLFYNQMDITEGVLRTAAENPNCGATVMHRLLNHHRWYAAGDQLQIPEQVLQAAARNTSSGVDIMDLLFADRYNVRISVITEKVIRAAAENPKWGKVMLIILLEVAKERGDSKTWKEYPWIHQLRNIGYNLQELVELLLDHHRDSPWLYFEPRNWPETKIDLEKHIPNCPHSFCHSPTDKTSPRNLVLDDGTSTTEIVEQLCGLAGICPTDRNAQKWAGSVNFSEEDQAAKVSYILPTDEDEAHPFGMIKARILSVLTRLCTAIGLVQEAGLCCSSFTTLKFTGLDHQSPNAYTAELIPVPFDTVVRLTQAVQSSDESCSSELLLAAKAVLQLVSPEIADLGSQQDLDCLHLCALAAQYLCLGFVSYMQAHTGPIQPFFLDLALRRIRLLGLKGDSDCPHISAELEDLSCMGNMTDAPVLVFRTDCGSPDRKGLQQGNVSRKYDVLAYLEDVLDTWGPGNFIYRKDAGQSPVAVRIRDGFLFACDNGKYHWSKSINSLEQLGLIDLQQQLEIGNLLLVNDQCAHVEGDCWTRLANAMDTLGTSRSWWDTLQLQAGLQGGQFVVGQLMQTLTKRKGGTVKEAVLAWPDADFIQLMDRLWGVQISYCTRVAKRVRLRTLVADLLPAFSLGRVSESTLKAISLLRDEALTPIELAERLKMICDNSIYTMVGKILRTLEHTGVDRTGRFFCIAWPYMGQTASCLNIALEGPSSWAKCLADSHCSATFAYMTMKCLETDSVRCSGCQKPIKDYVRLLETTVSCHSKTDSKQWTLGHKEVYFFDKLDTMFWVEVRREDRSRSARLVELVRLQAIPRIMKKRLELREEKRQRNCLREDTMFLQGEPVFISAL
jgi:phage tail protein X